MCHVLQESGHIIAKCNTLAQKCTDDVTTSVDDFTSTNSFVSDTKIEVIVNPFLIRTSLHSASTTLYTINNSFCLLA